MHGLPVVKVFALLVCRGCVGDVSLMLSRSVKALLGLYCLLDTLKLVMEQPERYFAYGSNLNAERMKERKAYYSDRVPAKLSGYRLAFAFNSGSGFGSATIVEDPNSIVHGALYTMEKGGLETLDFFEWVDRGGYSRVPVKVELENGEMLDCITYVAMPAFYKDGLIPSKTYLNHLLKGKDVLPSEYYSILENHECGS